MGNAIRLPWDPPKVPKEVAKYRDIEEEEEASKHGKVGKSRIVEEYWLWTAASAALLGRGISICKTGFSGSSCVMPLKAFAGGSLFVGAGGTAGIASLRASGINTLEDIRNIGANIRNALGVKKHEQALENDSKEEHEQVVEQ